jgi:rhamnose transport system permease protein
MSQDVSATATPSPAPARPRRGRGLLRWEWLLGAVVVLDFLLNALASPYFLDPWTLSDATYNFTEKAVVALPMAFLIIAGEIDISVAGIMALCSVMMGLAAQAGWPLPALLGVSLLTGLLAGCFNGVLVAICNVPSIVATIGTMSLFRGTAYAVLGDRVFKSYPPAFAYFGQGYVVGPVSFELVLFAVFAVIAALLLHFTPHGRRVYAIGNNPVAAVLSGVRVANYRFALFAAAGLASAVASILLTSRLGSTRPSIADGWELDIITMVVLGGVAVEGGAGTIVGVVLAALLMGLLTFGMGLLNVPGIVMKIVTGGLLVVVLALPRVVRRLRLLPLARGH